jgi:mono/diheme cytochrome c family protein
MKFRGCLFLGAMVLFSAPALSDEIVKHGCYLVDTVAACVNCHTPKGPSGPLPGKRLSGGDVIKHRDFTAVVPNITPDNETGIGRWTDEELILAIREGRRPDGSLLGPAMPSRFYRGIGDDDARAIAACLRAATPVSNPITAKSHYDSPLPSSWGPPVGEVAAPSKSDTIAYGAYLAGPVARCMDCHTDRHNGVDSALGAGGKEFHGPWGVSVAANITADKAEGIGDWTDDEIERAIRTGIGRAGNKLSPPMPFAAFSKMKPDDMAALIAYLRSLPPAATPEQPSSSGSSPGSAASLH